MASFSNGNSYIWWLNCQFLIHNCKQTNRQMDSPQILKSILSSSFSISQSKSLRKSRCFCSEFNSKVAGKRISNRSSKLVLINKRVSVCCKVQGGDSKSNGNILIYRLYFTWYKKILCLCLFLFNLLVDWFCYVWDCIVSVWVSFTLLDEIIAWKQDTSVN